LHARKSNPPVANSIFGVLTTGIKNLRETASRTEGEQQLSVKVNCISALWLQKICSHSAECLPFTVGVLPVQHSVQC